MLRPSIAAAFFFCFVEFGSTARLARAAPTTKLACGRVDPDVIHIDGLLEDWEGEPGIDVGGRDRDLSFTLRCNYDDRAIYLAVDVRDDKIRRTRAALAGEDHVEFKIGAARLTVFPELGRAPQRLVYSSGRGGGKPPGLRVSEARQMEGWSVEVGLPLTQVPGFVVGTPAIQLGVTVTDGDQGLGEAALAFAPGGLAEVEFEATRVHLQALLDACHVEADAIVFDRTARLSGGRPYRVVIAGRYVAAISDEYVYAEVSMAKLL